MLAAGPALPIQMEVEKAAAGAQAAIFNDDTELQCGQKVRELVYDNQLICSVAAQSLGPIAGCSDKQTRSRHLSSPEMRFSLLAKLTQA